MTQHTSYLEKLIGQVLIRSSVDTSFVVPITVSIGETSSERMSLTVQLYFENYRLSINNPITIDPADKEINALIGLRVIAAAEKNTEACITFENGNVLSVDMRDGVYLDPEAMCLYGPNNFFVVWN